MEYMSQEGYDNLVAELHELESVELPKVREAIAKTLSIMLQSVHRHVCSAVSVSSRRCWLMPA